MWNPYGTDEADQLTAEQARHVIARAASFLRPYRRGLVTAGASSMLWTASILAGPWLVKYGIDQGIQKDDAGALNRAVVAYVAIAAASYVVYRIQILAISRVGENFLRDLRVRVFDHLQRLSMPFYDREQAG